MLSADKISVRRAGRSLLDEVSLRLKPGDVHAVLGANGAGKSTLLKVLAGELAPDGGEVLLNGRRLRSYSPAALARQRAVLSQGDALAFPFTASEVVALGLLSASASQRQDEAQIVATCLAANDASHLAGRIYTQLSGGERARVQLARVLAQLGMPGTATVAAEPRFLLLDEPTAALDIAHQHSSLLLAQQLAAQGLGVLVVLHDLNLAAHYANRVSLLKKGRLLAQGPVDEVMTPTLLAEAFGAEMRFAQVSALGRMQIFAELDELGA